MAPLFSFVNLARAGSREGNWSPWVKDATSRAARPRRKRRSSCRQGLPARTSSSATTLCQPLSRSLRPRHPNRAPGVRSAAWEPVRQFPAGNTQLVQRGFGRRCRPANQHSASSRAQRNVAGPARNDVSNVGRFDDPMPAARLRRHDLCVRRRRLRSAEHRLGSAALDSRCRRDDRSVHPLGGPAGSAGSNRCRRTKSRRLSVPGGQC
jgi:hypothetical protein